MKLPLVGVLAVLALVGPAIASTVSPPAANDTACTPNVPVGPVLVQSMCAPEVDIPSGIVDANGLKVNITQAPVIQVSGTLDVNLPPVQVGITDLPAVAVGSMPPLTIASMPPQQVVVQLLPPPPPPEPVVVSQNRVLRSMSGGQTILLSPADFLTHIGISASANDFTSCTVAVFLLNGQGDNYYTANRLVSYTSAGTSWSYVANTLLLFGAAPPPGVGRFSFTSAQLTPSASELGDQVFLQLQFSGAGQVNIEYRTRCVE